MNKVRRVLSTGRYLGLALVLLGGAGCEDEPDTAELDTYFAEHPYGSESQSGGAAAMSISADPSSSLSTDYSMTVLKVTGGRAPYRWRVVDPGVGDYRDGNTGTSVVYIRYRAGDNAATVTDARGNTTSIVISQP